MKQEEIAAPAMASEGDAVDQLRSWAVDVCTPLVRELTFENAEEITEPHVPLLILFYQPPDDPESKSHDVHLFTNLIEQNFADYKGESTLLLSLPLSRLNK